MRSAERRRRELVFWYSALSPYMADRFTALARRGTVDFECWFTRVRNPGRAWEVGERTFPHMFVPTLPLTSERVGFPLRRYAAVGPRLMVTFHGDLGVAAGAVQGALKHRRLVYYVEKTFDEWTPRTTAKEILKGRLFANADGFLSPGVDADAYIRKYRPDATIHRLNHVVRTEHFARAVSWRQSPELVHERQALGLIGCVFLNVGRMWHQKGIGTLLDAYTILLQRGVTCSLLLVGDGIDREEYRARVQRENLPRVVFSDYCQQEALPRMYALGHAFVMPSRGDPYGIVVDEALASGMPVITTDHVGEIAGRVIPGHNGAIVPIDDPVKLADAMTVIARDQGYGRVLGAASQGLAMERGLDTWVDAIERFVSRA